MSLLKVEDISVSYGSVEALHGVSLNVDGGEIVTLLGANGAGKTTTLKAITGLLKIGAGSVEFDGQDITRTKAEEISRLGIAHVPEGRRIFPGLSVRDNLLLGASSRGRVAGKELEADLAGVLDMFPILGERLDALGWTLSGGQQQMLAVGRGLMAQPRLLIMDEPSLGLSPRIAQQVLDTLSSVRESGTTILLVEQNVVLALARSDRGYVLDQGRVALDDAASRLAENPTVRRTYLGDEVSVDGTQGPG